MADLGFLGVGAFGALMMGFLVAFLISAVLFYIYTAITLMFIAKKTKTTNGWMAWIPILNIYLMTKIGKVSPATLLVLVIPFIPIVNFLSGLVFAVMIVIWWWKIAEACKKPGWWGILMLVPVVNLIIMGILAWGK